VFSVGEVGGVDQQVLVDTYTKRAEMGSAEIARHMMDVDYLLDLGGREKGTRTFFLTPTEFKSAQRTQQSLGATDER
jgi:hypothetical protein